jgi:glyoxylase-like metal-dependent hydrolase (beta-lactamase superfamily II)
VSDGDTQIMLAGDASYLERTMLSGTIDGISADETIARSTLAAIRASCAQRPTIYLPAHDPQSADRLQERQTVAVSQQMKSTTAASARELRMSPAPAPG